MALLPPIPPLPSPMVPSYLPWSLPCSFPSLPHSVHRLIPHPMLTYSSVRRPSDGMILANTLYSLLPQSQSSLSQCHLLACYTLPRARDLLTTERGMGAELAPPDSKPAFKPLGLTWGVSILHQLNSQYRLE